MRFVLIAQPRTGTTVFRNLLNQKKSIFLYGEAFHPAYFKWGWYTYMRPLIQEDPTAMLPTNWNKYMTPYLEALYDLKEQNRKAAVGIDVKIPQAEHVRALPKAVRDCGAGVLHLRRRNTLASLVSYRIMTERVKRGHRAHGTKAAKNEPVQINVNWLKVRIPEFENQDNMVKWTYRDRPYMELFYEDFIGDAPWQSTCVRLSEFFQMTLQIPFTPSLQKQNSSNLADLIRNADEVKEHFPQFFES